MFHDIVDNRKKTPLLYFNGFMLVICVYLKETLLCERMIDEKKDDLLR